MKLRSVFKEIALFGLCLLISVGVILAGPFGIRTTYAAQFGRPISDIDPGGWVTTPLWSKLDDGSSGDDVYASGDGSPVSSEVFSVDISNILNPQSSSGHILRAQWSKESSGGADYQGTLELRQGFVSEASPGTLIATLTGTVISGTTDVTDTYTLSAGEVGNITDYTDLQLRAWATKSGGGPNRNFRMDFIEFETPDAPADLSWATGAADFEIWDSASLTWDAGTLVCGATLTDTNADTVSCSSSAVAGSTTYRVQVILKNTGGAAANMQGGSDFVDHKVVKTGWAGSNPTLGSCGFNDFGADNGSTTCSAAFNGNDARITNTGGGNVVIAATTGTEGFMFLITTDSSVPSSDSLSYMDSTIDTISEDSSKITITGPTSGPTTDQIMRHGNWFNAGAEQGFFWAD